jgi:hypothetical protein
MNSMNGYKTDPSLSRSHILSILFILSISSISLPSLH